MNIAVVGDEKVIMEQISELVRKQMTDCYPFSKMGDSAVDIWNCCCERVILKTR